MSIYNIAAVALLGLWSLGLVYMSMAVTAITNGED
jgi:hypothetical protein